VIKFYRILDWWLIRKHRQQPRPGKARGVLLVSSGGLGDTVLFSHVIERFLGCADKDEPVTVLLRSDAMKMAFLLPSDIQVIAVNFNRLRKDLGYRRGITDTLFAAHYRLVVHTDFLRHPDLDEALVQAAMAEDAVAMEPRPWRKYDSRLNANRALYSRLFDSGPAVQDKVLRWSCFADWILGLDRSPPTISLDLAQLPVAAEEGPDVIIQPFSAVKAKQSSPALYRRIIDDLVEGTQVAITGTQGDLGDNPEFKDLLDLSGVVYDSSSFAELIPYLRSAKMVISVDTALMHLAVAVGAPTLGLTSAAFVGEIVPYDPAITPENAHFLYTPMPCEGCLGNCIHPLQHGRFPCVAQLDENQVIRTSREIMSTKRGYV